MKRDEKVEDRLNTQGKGLSGRIELPENVGLPGSELYSEVPLLHQFSVLEINPDVPAEQYPARQISDLKMDDFLEGCPLIVPVFGRGRAFEVIRGDHLNVSLFHGLTAF